MNTIPAVVLELSKRVGLTPMDWKIYPDRVVIIFTTGQKMIFERDTSPASGAAPDMQHTTQKSTKPRKPRKS